MPIGTFFCKDLFQVGLATPCATVFAIIITTVYIIVYERRKDTLGGR